MIIKLKSALFTAAFVCSLTAGSLPARAGEILAISAPSADIALSFVAAGYGIKRRGRRGAQGLSVSIGFGLGVTFLYWVFFNFCLSLGYGGMLPPIVAAWIANFIFIGYGIVVFMNVEY